MELSAERGPFDMFGLFRQDDRSKWDVVLAADWVDGQLRPIIEFLVEGVRKGAGDPGLLLLSGVFALKGNDPFPLAIRETISVEHGLETIDPDDYGGVEVDRGYVMTSRQLPRK